MTPFYKKLGYVGSSIKGVIMINAYIVNPWTTKEIKYLKEKWDETNTKELALKLGRSEKSIKSKAYREGLIDVNNKKWTKEQLEYLEEKWGVLSIDSIAKKLNKTRESVSYKAYRLGYSSFTLSVDGITITELSKALNIDDKKIKRWAKNYSFPLFEKKITSNCTKTFVNLDDFWNWAEDHKELINFTLLEKYLLGAEPNWVDDYRKYQYKIY